MKRIKLKTTILTSLLFIPILFIGGGFNNAKINNKTLKDNPIDNTYGVRTHIAANSEGTYGFSTHKDGIDHLYMWGDNTKGELGVGNNLNDRHYDDAPMDITGGKNPGDHSNGAIMNSPLEDTQKITQLSIGSKHSGAVVETTDSEGSTIDQLWMWGDNTNGQLGDETNDESDKPINITKISPILKGQKITNLNLSNNTSEAALEIPAEGGVGIMQYKYQWGEKFNNVPTLQGDGKLLLIDTNPSNPYNPSVHNDGKANVLIYIIMGSISGTILIVAIIVISIMYHLYRKEKTKKQLI